MKALRSKQPQVCNSNSWCRHRAMSCRILPIQSLEFTVSSKIMFSFHANNLRQMLNDISRHEFQDISELVRLEGKHFVQTAHCALVLFMVVSLSEQFFRRRQDARPVSSDCCKTRTSCTSFRSLQNIFAFFIFFAKTILVKCIMIHLNDIFGAFKGLLCLQFLRQTDWDPIIVFYFGLQRS